MRPRSSGTSATPESITATPTPAPVSPRAPGAQPSCHTWSAPIASVVTRHVRLQAVVARERRHAGVGRERREARRRHVHQRTGSETLADAQSVPRCQRVNLGLGAGEDDAGRVAAAGPNLIRQILGKTGPASLCRYRRRGQQHGRRQAGEQGAPAQLFRWMLSPSVRMPCETPRSWECSASCGLAGRRMSPPTPTWKTPAAGSRGRRAIPRARAATRRASGWSCSRPSRMRL